MKKAVALDLPQDYRQRRDQNCGGMLSDRESNQR